MLLGTFNYCSALWKIICFCSSFCICHVWCKYTAQQYRSVHIPYYNIFMQLIGYPRFGNACPMFVGNMTDNYDTRITQLVHGICQIWCVPRTLLIILSWILQPAWLSSVVYTKVEYVVTSSRNFVFFCCFWFVLCNADVCFWQLLYIAGNN